MLEGFHNLADRFADDLNGVETQSANILWVMLSRNHMVIFLAISCINCWPSRTLLDSWRRFDGSNWQQCPEPSLTAYQFRTFANVSSSSPSMVSRNSTIFPSLNSSVSTPSSLGTWSRTPLSVRSVLISSSDVWWVDGGTQDKPALFINVFEGL